MPWSVYVLFCPVLGDKKIMGGKSLETAFP